MTFPVDISGSDGGRRRSREEDEEEQQKRRQLQEEHLTRVISNMDRTKKNYPRQWMSKAVCLNAKNDTEPTQRTQSSDG